MSNSSAEAWLVNGVSLNQYCWSVNSFAQGRDLPVLRGSNIPVAYIPGQVYRKKYPDSRTITLTMFANAIDPATNQTNMNNQHLQFSNNFQTLRQLFYNVGGGQFPLTRQWEYSLPVSIGIPTGVPTMVQATAMAEIAGNMSPVMFGDGMASFSVDLLLADPYFYSTPISYTIPYNTPFSVVNPGDDVAAYTNNTVTFNGPLQYPRLTNTTTDPDTWLQLNTVIIAGDSVTFDIANFTAFRQSDGGNLGASVAHSGTLRWMSYLPGVNSVLLSSSGSSDTGNAFTSFVAPFA